MSLPNIDDIIPEGPIRKWVYRIFAVLGAIAFLLPVGFAAANTPLPVSASVFLALYGAASSAGFVKAQANTPSVPVAPIATPDAEEPFVPHV